MIKKLAKKLARKSDSKSSKKTTTKVEKKTTKKSTIKKVNTEELFSLIEEKAYDYFVERGFCNGDDLADWYRAEQEVMNTIKK